MLLRILDRLEEIMIAGLMGAATLITFIAVAHRFLVAVPVLYPYLFGFNLAWSQELCIYMFIWMAKFGAAYGVRTGIHVGVDLLVNRLPEYSRKQVILFALLCGALFTGMIAAFGASFVGEMFHTGQQSNDLEAPMWFIYLAIPLGSGLMCFRFLQVAWSYFWTGELPHHDDTHVEGVQADASPALHPQPAGRETKAAARKVSPLGVI